MSTPTTRPLPQLQRNPILRYPLPLVPAECVCAVVVQTKVIFCKTRRACPDLQIKLALEVDFIPGYESWVRELVAQYPWDYLIGSVHYVSETWALYNPEGISEWKARDPFEVWTAYFERLTLAAQSGLFDIIGHADRCKKFCFYPKQDCTDLFTRFLQTAKQADVAIELNTAGLRKECREIYPGPAFLRLARQIGVPIAFGCDAHATIEVGMNFAEAVALARSVGYSECCRFAIARALARHRGKVTVLVPHYAMSGGTLIALAASEIVMSEQAVLGPVDPQVGSVPAASILRAVERKPIAEVEDDTLILADQSEMALNQLKQTIHDITTPRLPEHVRDALASDLSAGRSTHDYPVTVEEARKLGLSVSTEMPPEVLQLMALYPQPVRRQPSVEYSPGRRGAQPPRGH